MPDPTWDIYNGLASGFLNSGHNYSVVTEDGLNCVEGVDSNFWNHRLIGAWSSNMTIEFKFKPVPTNLSSWTSGYWLAELQVRDNSGYEYDFAFGYYVGSGSFFGSQLLSVSPNGQTIQRAAVDCNANEWHTCRCVISGGISYMFIDGYFYGKNLAATVLTSYNNNRLGFTIYASGSGVGNIFINTLKVSSAAKEPDCLGGLNIQGNHVSTKLAQSYVSTTFVPPTQLRYARTGRPLGSVAYGCELVPTTDPLASRVRILDGATVKAFQKFPTF